MCGICCIFGPRDNFQLNTEGYVENNSLLQNRGPDCSCHREVEVKAAGVKGVLSGHVLHLRGVKVTPQPTQHANGDIFLWNGEVYDGVQVADEQNDTAVLLDLLAKDSSPHHVLATMATIEGPWSFIYWQVSTQRLWFGRDVFGRRSLLWHLPSSSQDVFCLTSVQVKPYEFQEVPSVGLFCLEFGSTQSQGTDSRACLTHRVTLFPWRSAVWPGSLSPVHETQNLEEVLQGDTVCPGVSFEMNTDCELISKMPSLNKALPPLGFERKKVEDQSHLEYLKELVESDENLQRLTRQLTEVLLAAVKTRVNNQPKTPRILPGSSVTKHEAGSSTDNQNPGVSSAARVAILFSGGIDSTVIAALADRCVPADEPIDLINVAFELKPRQPPGTKKRTPQVPEPDCSQKWNVPDRQTGYVALAELNPARKWNFIEVNVTTEELREARDSHIRHLLYPLYTVLDDSIGCAIWFAARGQGILGNGENCGQPITSTARVMLCGMGADEQLVGYSRHRVRFKEQGWLGLLEEIELEITRISARNLGRDDRIITDHGKESRFPFLDERVVQYLSSLPIQDKADLSLPRGLGEKLLLRLCAVGLGLPNTAVLPKRAIQFGSRIAKLENSKEKASQSCTRLLADS